MKISPTPWGPAQTANKYGRDITFYSTAGHGGFHVSDPRLDAKIRSSFPRFRPFCGMDGWYEEDCDALYVFATFPDRFAGWKHEEIRAAVAADYASRFPALVPAPVFDPTDCGGAWDGFQVSSDADPGL